MSLRNFLYIVFVYYAFIFASNGVHAFENPSLELTFFDLGQGDSTFITTPQNKHILIDGGPTYEVDRLVFEKFGILNCYIDLVILTHPHSDHVYGLNRVLKRCTVGTIVQVPVDYSSKLYADWKSNLTTYPTREFYAGSKLTFDELTFYFLWPTKDYIKKVRYEDNLNNSSISFLVDYGNFEAVLTGDAEIDALSKMDLSTVLPLINGHTEVFKASHHGSANGIYENFIKPLNPQNVVISSGKGNRYGHPHELALEFFSDIKAKVYRTDLEGSINFKVY